MKFHGAFTRARPFFDRVDADKEDAMRTFFLPLVLGASLSMIGCEDMTPAQTPAAAHVDTSHVLITTADSISGPMDVVDVLDFHTSADSEDKGFDELKKKAAELGADAVTNARFEHGDGKEPSHLSGIAIRRGRPLQPYDVIRPLEVDTDEDADDKGFEELKRRAREVGADEIINIQFEHGEGNQPSKLLGLAVRTRR